MVTRCASYCAFAAAFALAGCATADVAEYDGVKQGAPYAVVTNQGVLGVTTTTCQMPGTDRICGAAVLLVDGHRLPVTAIDNRVQPGVRVLRLYCSFWKGPMLFGDIDATARDYVVELRAGNRYRVVGSRVDGGCDLAIVEGNTGDRVGKVMPFGFGDPVSQ